MVGGRSTDGTSQRVEDANNVNDFDVVLIDGSAFTGRAELGEIYGAWHIALDDIGTLKNHANFARLSADRDYELVESSIHLRNGYAVFERVEANR